MQIVRRSEAKFQGDNSDAPCYVLYVESEHGGPFQLRIVGPMDWATAVAMGTAIGQVVEQHNRIVPVC